jgi:hypothetical protein
LVWYRHRAVDVGKAEVGRDAVQPHPFHDRVISVLLNLCWTVVVDIILNFVEPGGSARTISIAEFFSFKNLCQNMDDCYSKLKLKSYILSCKQAVYKPTWILQLSSRLFQHS